MILNENNLKQLSEKYKNISDIACHLAKEELFFSQEHFESRIPEEEKFLEVYRKNYHSLIENFI